jgi:hypothetical protein
MCTRPYLLRNVFTEPYCGCGYCYFAAALLLWFLMLLPPICRRLLGLLQARQTGDPLARGRSRLRVAGAPRNCVDPQ